MEDCLFCQIIKGKKPSHKVYEDEDVYAFLDINPKVKGHTLVVPKEHSETFLDLDSSQIDTLFESVQKIAKGITETVNAEGFNLMQNNGRAAGQVVDHVHVHILPRKQDDGLDMEWSYEPEGEFQELKKEIKNSIES